MKAIWCLSGVGVGLYMGGPYFQNGFLLKWYLCVNFPPWTKFGDIDVSRLTHMQIDDVIDIIYLHCVCQKV